MTRKRYWMCIIGPVDQDSLPSGSDASMRDAVGGAFVDLTGKDNELLMSGWGLGEKRKNELLELWCKEQDHEG